LVQGFLHSLNTGWLACYWLQQVPLQPALDAAQPLHGSSQSLLPALPHSLLQIYDKPGELEDVDSLR
jgi:hypothetical protein